jgi:hypothetical protein
MGIGSSAVEVRGYSLQSSDCHVSHSTAEPLTAENLVAMQDHCVVLSSVLPRCSSFGAWIDWQHIMWKPTSPCKLWKLQYESRNVDSTWRSEEVGGVICIAFANHASHHPWILQISSSTSHELSFGSRSCDSNWSLHSLHEEVGFH